MNDLELLKGNIQKINYKILEKDFAIITPIPAKVKRPFWPLILIALGCLRLLQKDFVFSIIPILAGIYFYTANSDEEEKKLNRENKEVKILPDGLTSYSLEKTEVIEFKKNDISDLTIERLELEDKETIHLIATNNNGEEMEILRAFNKSSITDTIVEKLKEYILETWKE